VFLACRRGIGRRLIPARGKPAAGRPQSLQIEHHFPDGAAALGLDTGEPRHSATGVTPIGSTLDRTRRGGQSISVQNRTVFAPVSSGARANNIAQQGRIGTSLTAPEFRKASMRPHAAIGAAGSRTAPARDIRIAPRCRVPFPQSFKFPDHPGPSKTGAHRTTQR